jgi:hypothetical protein
MRTPTFTHFGCELSAVRIVVTGAAGLPLHIEIRSRALAPMAAAAWDRLMLRLEGEARSAVLVDVEARRPKPMFVVTGAAVCRTEASPMHVPVAIAALVEFEPPKSALRGQLGGVAALAVDVLMGTPKREIGQRMRAQADLARQAHPANARVAIFTTVAELGFVNLCMTGNAIRARARRSHVAFIMAGFTFGFGVAGGEAQTWMVLPHVRDLAPVGLVVTGGAVLSAEAAIMGIFVTGRAFGFEP